MLEQEKEIITKIKKLLILANSSNKNEAEIAATKAQELLIKHNLSMQTMDNIEYIEEELSKYKRLPIEISLISTILTKYFFVGVMYTRYYKEVSIMRIFGTKSNIEIANYIYIFLLRTYKNLWQEYKKENRYANRKSFYFGITSALYNKLDTTKNKVESEYGLILKEDIKIKEWLSISKTRNINNNSKDLSSYYKGYEKGKNINIRTPITTDKNTGSIKYLE